MIILFLFFGFLQLIRTDNTFFKCSPLDGELDTYSFISNSEMGIACVRGSGQSDLVFYIEKQGTDGLKKMAVGAAKYDATQGFHVGHLYRLYPQGPKIDITINANTGYLQLNVVGGQTVTLSLRPDGLIWNPADIRLIKGCANENPQMILNVLNPYTNLNTKSMLCAMKSGSHSGYHAMYGFGLRQNERNAWHPYFYLGQSLNPMAPSGSLNVAASLFEVCLQSDCTRCRKGLKSMTLTS